MGQKTPIIAGVAFREDVIPFLKHKGID